MVWVRSPVYFYKRNDTYYFSRAVPSDLRHRFNKKKIEVSLRTKSEAKAAKSAAALSDRLERYWDSIRMEMIYSRELGISVVPDKIRNANETELRLSDALSLYQRLKGMGKTALVTAAGQGQGKAVALAMARKGAKVFAICDYWLPWQDLNLRPSGYEPDIYGGVQHKLI